jgi:hypothetical protein
VHALYLKTNVITGVAEYYFHKKMTLEGKSVIL